MSYLNTNLQIFHIVKKLKFFVHINLKGIVKTFSILARNAVISSLHLSSPCIVFDIHRYVLLI